MIFPRRRATWLVVCLVLVVAAFGSGIKVGSDLEYAKQAREMERYREALQEQTKKANNVAMDFEKSLLASQDTASKLRKELSNAKAKFVTCSKADGVRFTGDYIRLHNDALQTSAADPGESDGASAGASIASVLDTQIENGRRWKSCRDQLNALIDVLEQVQ